MIRIFKFFIAFILLPQFVWACQSCFGANVDTATTQGIEYAMLGLLAITGFVSTGIVMFFISIKKRSKLVSQNYSAADPNQSNSEIMDQLLDKINEEGFEGLSREEKDLLKEVSELASYQSDIRDLKSEIR